MPQTKILLTFYSIFLRQSASVPILLTLGLYAENPMSHVSQYEKGNRTLKCLQIPI